MYFCCVLLCLTTCRMIKSREQNYASGHFHVNVCFVGHSCRSKFCIEKTTTLINILNRKINNYDEQYVINISSNVIDTLCNLSVQSYPFKYTSTWKCIEEYLCLLCILYVIRLPDIVAIHGQNLRFSDLLTMVE